MRGKRNGMIPLIVLVVVLAVVAAGLLFMALRYHIVDMKLYPRDAVSLDLRDQEITADHYERLQSVLPECEITWSVPFRGGTVSSDIQEITVTELSLADVEALAYLPRLHTVYAEECTDYDLLMQLRQQYPMVQVLYKVLISGTYYDQDATLVRAGDITQEEILKLQYLPELQKVVACGGDAGIDYSQLRNYCRNTGLEFAVLIGGEEFAYETEELTLTNAGEEDLHMLQYLKGFTKLHLVQPAAAPETVFALKKTYPDAEITWEVEIAGLRYLNSQKEIDLSQVVIDDLSQVETAVNYLPDVKQVTLGLCGKDNPDWGNSKATVAACPIENEAVAAFRDRVKDHCKVVWTVRLGPHIALRTDADNFMPNHFGVGQLPDEYAYNLRYCIDMVCLDVGHMTLTDISFVSFMPKLKYLILAWTEVQYIEPIRSCKNLVFLELDNSCIRDISPLVDCTALEDLNIGKTWPDVTPLTKMPWLKNVYMIFGSRGDAWKVTQALPDTRVVVSGNATVGGNWRKLQNYYDMRDMLHMPYMN